MDIQFRMLISQLHSLQDENAHLKVKVAGCVSREQHDAVCAERDMNAALLKEAEEGRAAVEKELAEPHG